jgi:hypothetical protein
MRYTYFIVENGIETVGNLTQLEAIEKAKEILENGNNVIVGIGKKRYSYTENKVVCNIQPAQFYFNL